MLKIGIMGAAKIVPRFVAGVKESGQAEVIGIAARNKEKAEKAALDLGIPEVYDDYVSLVKAEEIDLIYIPLINKQHYPKAKLALEAGKNVLLEKPFTLTLKESQELFKIANEKNLFLMEAQKSVFLPVMTKIKKWLDANEIGKVSRLAINDFRPHTNRESWALDIKEGGGAFIMHANYPLSVLQFLFGTGFDEAKGIYWSPEENKADLDYEILLKKAEIMINISLTTRLDKANTFAIYGEKGEISVPNYWKSNQASLIRNGEMIEEFSHPMPSEFSYEIDEIAELINSGKKKSEKLSPEMTMTTVKIVEDLYQEWFGKDWPNIK